MIKLKAHRFIERRSPNGRVPWLSAPDRRSNRDRRRHQSAIQQPDRRLEERRQTALQAFIWTHSRY